MALLKGFPPSNSISPTTHIPEVIEIVISLMNVPIEERFRDCDGAEFMKIRNDVYSNCPLALCYKAGPDIQGVRKNTPGEIYGFSKEKEVVWLRRVYPVRDKVYPTDCCQWCGEKLTSDVLSKQFGDWCSNASCNR